MRRTIVSPDSGDARTDQGDGIAPEALGSLRRAVDTTKAMFQRMRVMLPFLLLVGIIVMFSLISPFYFQLDNFTNIARQSASLIVLSLGMTFVIIAGSIDLSVGAIAGLAAVVTASLMTGAGVDSALLNGNIGSWALLVGLLVGSSVGLLNGALFAIGRVPSFLVTLGMLTIVRGLILVYTDGQPLSVENDFLDTVGSGKFLGLPVVFIIAMSFYGVCLILARRTVFGRHVYAVGGGERVGELSGVPVRRVKILVFVIAGAFAALAGAMLVARNVAGSPTMGLGLELIAIAAVVLGGTPLTGGVGGPTGTVVGALIISSLSTGLNVVGISPNWQNVILGAVLIAAVLISTDRKTLQVMK